jgi:hypothetical protein
MQMTAMTAAKAPTSLCRLFDEKQQGEHEIRAFTELKTSWNPVGACNGFDKKEPACSPTFACVENGDN